ncbi:hypothetical protein EAH79_17165 [Sphingomonas koreensis]|nr:hypothetical protein EAH87_17520 [Sphingomonas koreensis]TPG38003.1 hypothetical protein EAH79_17165 [Sphingomonas koreensis]
MTTPPFPAALLTLLAAPLLGASPPPSSPFEGQMLFHQHIVIRIPRMPPPRAMAGPAPMPPIEWEEKSGPKCVEAAALVAATIPTEDRVDLMMRDGQRMRARLDKKCRALDFYTGFYVQGGSDGQICADRDSIRTRSGDNCGIDKFRRLVPAN